MGRNEEEQNDDFKQMNTIKERIFRGILFAAGSFFLGLGIIGIVIPLLPTTPFLLLAAACYARSSKRFYNWLLNNKLFGSYIRNYRDGKGIPLKVKLLSILFLWLTIGITTYFFVNLFLVRIILIIIAIGVTIHVLTIKTLKEEPVEEYKGV